MKSWNWGIVGLGSIANDFAKALCDSGRTLYAAASRTQEKADAFAARYHARKAYGSYEELYRDPDVDIIYVATPHSCHYEVMMECLEHGKHVLCEKAITVSDRQLEQVTRLAQQKGLIVMEAMTVFHMPLYRRLHEILQAGELGPVKMVQVLFGCDKEYDPNNRFFSKDLAGGALLDIGTYALSFARFFLQEDPQEVATLCQLAGTGVDEQSGIVVKNSAGEMAVVTLAFRARTPHVGIVACEFGNITVDGFPRAQSAKIHRADGREETIEAGDTALAMQYEIQDMEQAVESGRDETLKLTQSVVSMMSKTRRSWGITYPFES